MTLLWWLLPFVVVTTLAWAVITLVHRPRGRADAEESLAAREQFRKAMEKPLRRRRTQQRPRAARRPGGER